MPSLQEAMRLVDDADELFQEVLDLILYFLIKLVKKRCPSIRLPR